MKLSLTPEQEDAVRQALDSFVENCADVEGDDSKVDAWAKAAAEVLEVLNGRVAAQ